MARSPRFVFFGSSLFLSSFAWLLAGCPDGAGLRDPGQNDSGDAFAEGAVDDAGGAREGSTSEGGEPPATSGALCGVNDRDDCGPFLLCDKTLGCVECRTDLDCPLAAAHCLDGQCVGCRPAHVPDDGGLSDCRGTASACWASDFSCHPPCGDVNACPLGTTCDNSTGECAGCTGMAPCDAGVCSSTKHRCVECLDDSMCPASLPRCRKLTGTCVTCTSNRDCGVTAPICDPITFTCREGCTSDGQCPGKRCDAASATCVAEPAATTDASADG